MSNASSSQPVTNQAAKILWNPWLGVIYVVAVYYVSQLLSGVVISIYPGLKHWTNSQALSWLNESIGAQFVFILLAESFAIGALYLFLHHYKVGFKAIGLRRPRWSDPLHGIVAAPVYYVLFAIMIGLISHYVQGINFDQKQELGFDNVSGAVQLTLTFISLVILPPITEEIMVRGFLYSSLKKALNLLPAAIFTSLIFASAHLPEGGASGPLYVAAIDTFVLSLVLIYLREKTGGLWASITLHAIKNGIAFFFLYLH